MRRAFTFTVSQSGEYKMVFDPRTSYSDQVAWRARKKREGLECDHLLFITSDGGDWIKYRLNPPPPEPPEPVKAQKNDKKRALTASTS